MNLNGYSKPTSSGIYQLNSAGVFDNKPRKQSPFRTYGATGTEFFSGFITNDEYLPELTGLNAISIYDKMRRNDAQIHGTLYAIMLPIRQATWFIEPASDKPEDKEIAERIQKNLFREMSITWDDFLRQALGYLPFGYSIFEKVFKVTDDNKIMLSKLAPRKQSTIYRWYTDKDDNFSGVQQFVQKGDSSNYDYIDIWREKLVMFTNDQEGNNFEGISVLRSAYKHWYIKDKLYKIDAIGHDRWASGFPVVTESPSANEGDKKRVSTILKNLHSREQAYMHLPNEWKMEMFEKSGGNEAIIGSIKHHNEEISKNILAQFINLGTSDSGSRSLGESFEELFAVSLNAIGEYFSEIMNRFVIKQLVDMNWNVKEYPRLKSNRIILNGAKWMESLAKMGLNNAFTRDNPIEQLLRETAGLPKLTDEIIAEREKLKKEIQAQAGAQLPGEDEGKEPTKGQKKEIPKEDTDDDKGATIHDDVKKLKEYKHRRKLTEYEEQLCDLDEIEATLDSGVDKFTKQVLKIKDQQARFLSTELLVKTADQIKMPYVEKLAERLFKEQKRQMNKGKRHLREEIEMQKMVSKNKELTEPELLDNDEFSDSEEVLDYLNDKSKADSTAISNKTLGLGLFALYNLDPSLTTDTQKSNSIYDSIMTTGNRDIANIASASTNKAYGLGREVQAGTYTDQIEFAVYSAVLDHGTCNQCSPKDGVEHAIDNPDFQTPNPTCAGGGKCRCVNIYKIRDVEMMGNVG